MVQIKLTVAFILAAAAIAPVVALPVIPNQDRSVSTCSKSSIHGQGTGVQDPKVNADSQTGPLGSGNLPRDYESLQARGINELIQKGIQKGIQQGIHHRIQQGIQQGIEKGTFQRIMRGFQQGRHQGQHEGHPGYSTSGHHYGGALDDSSNGWPTRRELLPRDELEYEMLARSFDDYDDLD